MQKLIWSIVVLLVILHQDIWFWNDDTLVFGFMPIGLFYHACLSVAASITWFLAIQFCWPIDTDFDTESAHHSAASAEGAAK